MSGTPVFAALLNGMSGGELTVTEDGFRFERRVRRPLVIHSGWERVQAVRLRRKGPYGSAGLLDLQVDGRSLPWVLEVSDSPRLLAALDAIPAVVTRLDGRL